MEFLTDLLKNNDFAKGGLLMVVAGSLLAYFRQVPYYICTFLLRQFTVEVTFFSTDQAFEWIEEWLNYHEYLKRCRRLFCFRDPIAKDDKPILVPSYGYHILWYKFKPILLSRTKEDIDMGEQKMKLRDSISLRIFSRNQDIVAKIVEEGKSLCNDTTYNKTIIRAADYSRWVKVSSRPLGQAEPVLAQGLYQNIVNDLESFLHSEEDYQALGIPYKRGYLLYGPPGNGKTTTIVALAQRFQKHICFLNLSNAELTDNNLMCLLSNLPNDSILALEDIDCLEQSHNRNEDSEDTNNALTLSGLLNTLDGVLTPNGLVFIATTNHIDKIDPALIRAGRFDRRIYLGLPSYEQKENIIDRFGVSLNGQREKIMQNEMSMAEIQNTLLSTGEENE